MRIVIKKLRNLFKKLNSAYTKAKMPFIISSIVFSEQNKNFIINCNIKKLFKMQYRDGRFNRMDIIVRYLAIEEYYGQNSIGYDLYQKMQKKRGQFRTHNLERFKNLIYSFNENNYNHFSRIIVNHNLGLIDGSHRFACALFFGINNIPIAFSKGNRKVNYDINWFEENGFSDNELKNLLLKLDEIADKLNKNHNNI